MKLIAVILLSVLLTVGAGLAIKALSSKENSDLVSPLFQTKNQDWQIFVNNYFGYKIKHPSDVEIKNSLSGDITLYKPNSISLMITQKTLADTDTLDSVIKNDIAEKQLSSISPFSLTSNTSPIALGHVTALTFQANENNLNITYYYVPQTLSKYLIIVDQTQSGENNDNLVSESIVYSLEFMP